MRGQLSLAVFLVASAVALPLASHGSRTPEERVDQKTQQALTRDADAHQGGELYTSHCAACHGPEGHGEAKRAIPSLAGQRFNYLVRQLANFSEAERDSVAMHRALSATAVHEPQAWVDLSAYLNRLPALEAPGRGSGEHSALGRGIFHEQCASCHDQRARGDRDGFVPVLRHQHYQYLVRQMNAIADGHRHNVDEELIRFMRSLESQDIAGLADYLSRLKGDARAPDYMRSDGVVVN